MVSYDMLKIKNPYLYRIPAALILGFLGQWAWSYTGGAFLWSGGILLMAGVFIFIRPDISPKRPIVPEKMSLSQERFLFGSIFILAFVMRVYGLDSQPPGLYIDQGFGGWGGLRILHEGWRPYGMQEIIFNWPLPLYQMALWFALFKPTAVSLSLFFVTAGLAAFPFIYLVFRRLSGPRTALVALFFLSVMFWHINISRNGYWSGLTLLYCFATLFFFLETMRSPRLWKWALAILFFAAGFYVYQSYKIFPFLMVVYLLYEFRKSQRGVWPKPPTLLFLTVFLIGLCLPFAWDWGRQGLFSGREAPFFIGRVVAEQKSLRPLWDNLVQWAFLFNHQGDPDPLNRVGERAMLDPVTGLFFLFGFFCALKKPFQRDHFYPLAGFFILSLPSLLAVGLGSYRMAAVLPMEAFFASKAFWFSWERWGRKFKGGKRTALAF